MPHSPEAVANKFLELAKEKGAELTLMKLLKLAYFAHAWHLALKDDALLNERIEAWQFGPVSPTIYHQFKSFGSKKITKLAEVVDFDLWRTQQKFGMIIPRVEKTPFLNAFFDKIWEVYGGLTAFQLSDLTHEHGSPWHQVWFEKGGKDIRGTDIPNELIKSYFLSKLKSKSAHV